MLDAAGPDVVDNRAFSSLFGSLTESMFHQAGTSGKSEKMLPWLEQQKDQPFVTPDLIERGASDVVRQGKLPEALDWLERMNVGRETQPLGVRSVMLTLTQQPGVLASVPAATLDRIVAMAPNRTPITDRLAAALEAVSPAHAGQLRGLAPDPAWFDPSQPVSR